jgi:tetratricopeptide (TPR) repeat protein
MKKFVGAVTFLAGILVGAFLIYMTLHKSVSDEFDKKEATYRSAIGLLREDKARTSRELSEATDEKRALELKLANLHRELGINEVELKELREENKRLKTLIARHEAQSSGSTDHSATPKAQTEEGQKTNDEALIKELEKLLAQVELNPSDRNLVRRLLDKAEHVGNMEDLKDIVEKLRKIMDEALAAAPGNADLLFNRGNAYGLELLYLQPKIKENPMVYGPKMGEIAFKALDCFDKVVAKKPGDNEALLTRAFWRYYTPGKIEDAREDFTELVKRAGEQSFDQDLGVQIFAGMAMTCMKTGKKVEAKKAVEEGLALYPRSERLRELLKELQK